MSALNQLIQSLPLRCCFLEVAQCYCTYLSVSNTHVNKHLQFSSVYFSCSFSAPYLSTGLMWKELLTIYYSDIQKNIILQFHFIANMSQAIMLLHSSSSLAGCINSCVDIFTWIVKVSHRITFIVQRLSISARLILQGKAHEAVSMPGEDEKLPRMFSQCIPPFY